MIGCHVCNRRLAVCSGHQLNGGGQTWKAGWVHALAGSNPASSAAVTAGNALGSVELQSQSNLLVSVLVLTSAAANYLSGPCVAQTGPPGSQNYEATTWR
jgi:hypothetical protein